MVDRYLPESDKGPCEVCGGELEEWKGQYDESEVITVIERSFKRQKIRLHKRRCKCGSTIATPAPPPKPIKGGRYTAEFAVEVAIQKYLDHLPLERQVKIMKREGLVMDSQTSMPAVRWKRPGGSSEITGGTDAFDLLGRLRRGKSRPVLERIKTWAQGQLSLPQSALRKALVYMLGHWDGLTVFVDDPKVPLDNNLIERTIRGPVIGRKNHYGSKSVRGTKVAAIFYSMIETAKLQGVDPKQYLLEAAYFSIHMPGTVFMPSDIGSVDI